MNILIEKNHLVPMRDGIKLATDVYRPSSFGRFSVLLTRTPYNQELQDRQAVMIGLALRAVQQGYVDANTATGNGTLSIETPEGEPEGGLDYVAPIGRALVEKRPDRLIWGSDWPHLPNGQRDTGEVLNLLGDWAPDAATREKILVDGPNYLFFYK